MNLGHWVVLLLAIIVPSQVTAKSWLIEGPSADNGKRTCENSTCTCNGKIDGIGLSISLSKNTSTECHTYHRNLPLLSYSGGLDKNKIKVATDALDGIPEDFESTLGYGTRVNYFRSEVTEIYGVLGNESQAQKYDMQLITKSLIRDLSILLCPKEHSISNTTLSDFKRLQKLTIEGDNSTVKVTTAGWVQELESLTSLRINNVVLNDIHQGDFCDLQYLDEIVLRFTNSNVIQGFNCQAKSCQDPCLKNLITANLTGNKIAAIGLQFSNVFSKIEELFLDQNKLVEINVTVFNTLRRLQTLDLSQNKIRFISGVFKDLPNLKMLNLSGNALTWVDFKTFQNLDFLEILSIAHNHLQTIDSSYLPDSIQELYLQNNNISELKGSFLTQFRRKFRLLNLTNNSLREFSQGSIESCDYACRDEAKIELWINGNRLDCNCSMEWLDQFTKQDSKHLSVPDIELAYKKCWNRKEDIASDVRELLPVEENDFICSCQPDRLYQGTSACIMLLEQCPKQCACSTSTDLSEHTTHVVDCSSKNLKILPKDLPYEATLTKLDGNRFGHIRSTNSTTAIHSTKVLYLNNSQISSIDKRFFSEYPNLILLFLHKNKLFDLPADIFSQLQSNVISVTLHDNNIEKFDLDIFYNSTVEIGEITLYDNPWDCDCDFGLHFRKWILDKKLLDLRNFEMTCERLDLPTINFTANFSLSASSTLALNDTEDTEQEGGRLFWKVDFERCLMTNVAVENPLNQRIVAVVSSVGGVVLLIVALGIVVFVYRELILVWLYNNQVTNRLWRPKEKADDQMKYDAYVVFTIGQSKKVDAADMTDVGMVKNILSPRLEGEPPHFLLHLEYRDAPLGGTILNNIQYAVDNSRRIVILLTENFLKDSICLEVFKIAHHRCVEEKKTRLIVILVGDPPRDEMPEDIQNFIKSGAYIRWGNKWFWEKLIYKMPHVTRQPRPLGPYSGTRDKTNSGISYRSSTGDFEKRFSDNGREIPLGSIYSESSEGNRTPSEYSLDIHGSSPSGSNGYVSQSQSNLSYGSYPNISIANNIEEDEDFTNEQEDVEEQNQLLNHDDRFP